MRVNSILCAVLAALLSVSCRPKAPHIRILLESEHIYDSSAEFCKDRPWELDRIEHGSPFNETGAGVHVYIVDTGISDHADFQGRLGQGIDCTISQYSERQRCQLVDQQPFTDTMGHGTHVAGIAGGTCFSISPNVILHSVKVVDDSGTGSLNSIIQGIRWATVTSSVNGWPGVINLSLTTPKSDEIDEAIKMAVEGGMIVTSAAGNQALDACMFSPGSSPLIINTGGSKTIETSQGIFDIPSAITNTGKCVTVYAPAEHIPSASNTEYNGVTYMSGTSQAAPAVASVAALYLERYPNATQDEFKNAITKAAKHMEQEQQGSSISSTLKTDTILLLSIASLFE